MVENVPWIPSLGAHYNIGIDGISMLMVMLTTFSGVIAIFSSWSGVEKNLKQYYAMFLLLQTGMIGVFISLDFLMFFLFWEMNTPIAVGRAFRPLYILLSKKYYFDELYEDILVRRVFYGGVAYAFDWFDRSVVDALVRLIGWFAFNAGTALRQTQTGQLQAYGMAISIGILIIFGAFLFIR